MGQGEEELLVRLLNLVKEQEHQILHQKWENWRQRIAIKKVRSLKQTKIEVPVLAGPSTAWGYAFYSLWGRNLIILLPYYNLLAPYLHNIGWNGWKCNAYEFFACGLTTSLTAETGTVRGEGVGGGEGGTAMEEVGGEEDGGAGVLRGAGSVL